MPALTVGHTRVFSLIYGSGMNDQDILDKFKFRNQVPTLVDGDIKVWESLAILEYLAEKFPSSGLWPAEVTARAHARVRDGAAGSR